MEIRSHTEGFAHDQRPNSPSQETPNTNLAILDKHGNHSRLSYRSTKLEREHNGWVSSDAHEN
jgi:hypothetical protein